MKVAAIGIGSNSVRLLIAEQVHARLSAVERLQAVTRLASFATAHAGEPLLAEDSIGKTWATVGHFARHAREHDATLLGVVATEAVRAAANRAALTEALERDLGVPVTIISGEEEAALGWRAIALGYEPGAHLGVIDIGGASTDLSVGEAGALEPQGVESLKLGSRTLMRRFRLDRPVQPGEMAGVMNTISAEWGRRVAGMRPAPQIGVAIGGTAEVLAELRHDSLDGNSWSDAPTRRAWLARWLERTAALDPEGRAALGVPADRADVIAAGGAILLSVLNAWGLRHFYLSQRNILDGFLAQALGDLGDE